MPHSVTESFLYSDQPRLKVSASAVSHYRNQHLQNRNTINAQFSTCQAQLLETRTKYEETRTKYEETRTKYDKLAAQATKQDPIERSVAFPSFSRGHDHHYHNDLFRY